MSAPVCSHMFADQPLPSKPTSHVLELDHNMQDSQKTYITYTACITMYNLLLPAPMAVPATTAARGLWLSFSRLLQAVGRNHIIQYHPIPWDTMGRWVLDSPGEQIELNLEIGTNDVEFVEVVH